MTPPADYTYDREADCFVVTDARGNEICRTRSPHQNWQRTYVSDMVERINNGELTFFPQQEVKQP